MPVAEPIVVRRRRLVGATIPALLLLAALAACGSDDPASPIVATSMTKVRGDSQSVAISTAVAQPMVVRLAGGNGSPLAGLSVSWTLATGGSGALGGISSLTDATGEASMTFTAGTVAGPVEVAASFGALPIVVFTQIVTGGAPANLAKLSGDGAAGLVGAGVQLVARVTDSTGNPVSGVAVSWATGASGGTLSAASSTTDNAGRARVTLTLGATPGVYTVTATSGTLGSVTFSVTAI